MSMKNQELQNTTGDEKATRENVGMNEGGRPLIPEVDIIEKAEGISLIADLPGADRNSVQVHMEDNVLTLTGEIGLRVPTDLRPLYTEVNGKRYARSFTLSRELDGDRIQAEIAHGVLKLFIPKKEAHKPRKIEVKLA